MKYALLFFMFTFYLFGQNTKLVARYYVDKSHHWSVEEAYHNRNRFSVLTQKNATLGFTEGNVWIYVNVQNLANKNISEMLEFPYPLHDYITVYVHKNGHFEKEYMTGDLTPFDTRKIKTNDFVIPYTLKAFEKKEILFKFSSNSSLNIGIRHFSLKEYYSNVSQNGLFLGLYYGAVLIMLMYNFILFLMIKEWVYLYYVVFHMFHLALQLGLNGLAFEYFYPHYPAINHYFIPIVFSLTNYYSIQFTVLFLELERYNAVLALMLNRFKYLFLFTMISIFFLSYNVSIILITILSMLNIVLLFLISIYILYRYRTMASKFFVSAWSFLLIGGLSGEMQNMGLIHMNRFSLYAPQIGAFFELALLSFALAYRYNEVFSKLTCTEGELRELNVHLEDKVRERTFDLDEKNKELFIEINNKNILFRELYHRVKNNLQIISGLLSLQIRRVIQKESKDILADTNQRIKSMAMIHEKLYQSDDLTAVNMQEYTHDLVEELQHSLEYNDILFMIQCEKIRLTLETAVPMGLIINELVTNAVKYAFPAHQSSKNIAIKMYTVKHDAVILEVYDNGKGVKLEKAKEGFGFKLVQSLAGYQLKGDIETYNSQGLHHKITFPGSILL
ncbi:7TM diverse intracellular signaling domain-containing protein [Sulfurovum sp.]|uniref:7TM diverse intracellular signaling domain-containing protein n=1 Tax=Sulfurovum sp. TaxID=1969726 RepID=UPI0025F74FD0|nr:7TM diverse intracellular signaling domain-containing protein [Sulfurovum sp.]